MEDKFKRFFLGALRSITNDKLYYQIRYFIKFKKFINFDRPSTFNEKLHWLKLHDRDPEYKKLVDKYEVRNFIKEKIGAEHLVELYGIYSCVEEIDFDELPNSFVLKGTHGAGWVLLCEDKATFDIEEAKKEMRKWLKFDFYKMWGEAVYKDVPPRIICEEMLTEENDRSLIDYKIFCFNGSPKLVNTVVDRQGSRTKDFYDLKWKRLPFTQGHPQSKLLLNKPKTFDKMLDIATVLSDNLRMVRVDLYEVNGNIYFGELTFYPSNGLRKFNPPTVDHKLGNLIEL